MRNERLRALLLERGQTPDKLAEAVDVDAKTVERWITKGRTPYRSHRYAVATFLGVDESYIWPDALGRVWDAASCPTSGEVLLSAADGVEFTDWGGASHLRGGSHGSLSAGDSLVPLICAGLCGALDREQWSIKDVVPLIARHFALS